MAQSSYLVRNKDINFRVKVLGVALQFTDITTGITTSEKIQLAFIDVSSPRFQFVNLTSTQSFRICMTCRVVFVQASNKCIMHVS